MELCGKIAQCNGRLKAAGVKVRIEQDGKSLRLRATLPPKPGSHRQTWYQQRIYPRLGANPAHLKLAEKEARTIGALIAQNRFDWSPYLKMTDQLEKVNITDLVSRWPKVNIAVNC